MTWVACWSTDGGMTDPRTWAVCGLTTKSTFIGCSIGSSAGLAALRILAT